MLYFKFINNFEPKKIISLVGIFCLTTLASCDGNIKDDCGNFLPHGKESHLILKNFSCENKDNGLTRFSFSGRFGFNFLNPIEQDDGLQSNKISNYTADQKNINILVVDQIVNPNLEISIAQCQKPWSNDPDEDGNPIGRRCTLREFAQQEEGALFIVNGGHFHYSYSRYQPFWDRNIQNYEIGDSVGLLKINANTLADHPYQQVSIRKNWGVFSLRQGGDFPTIGSLTASVDKVLLNAPHVITAAPLLIRNCVVAPLNKIYQDTLKRWPGPTDSPGMINHLRTKIARTAIGTDLHGRLYIFNVDGNIPHLSSGMTLEQVAGVMASLGLCDAMALEGGNSASIFDVIKDAYLNEGPKRRESPMATALIIKKRNPPFRIRKILNKSLTEHGVLPHTDHRIINPKNIENHLAPKSDIPLLFLSSRYVNENKSYYFSTEEQRKIYRMKIENGLIINPHDDLPASGLGKYVVSRDHELYVAFLKSNEVYPTIDEGKNENRSLANPGDALLRLENFHIREIRHSYFTSGGPIIAGGWIEIQNGKIKCIDNHSGHYVPGSMIMHYLLRMLKYDYNVDLDEAYIYHYKNPQNHAHSRCWEMRLPQ